MSVERVTTARLRGEAVSLDHLDALAELYDDERVMATLGGVRSRAETRAQIDALAQHWAERGYGYWVFFDRESGELVGRGGLRHLSIADVGEEVEVGWAVVAERWRQGLATEMARVSIAVAFDELGLDSIVAFTTPHNEASLGVMRTTGFTYERDVTWAGLPHVLHRLRRADWAGQPP